MDRGSQKTVSPPAYATVRAWCALSGMGRTAVFAALARGDLVGVKLGARTLIDVIAGLVWLRSLPPAGPAPRRA